MRPPPAMPVTGGLLRWLLRWRSGRGLRRSFAAFPARPGCVRRGSRLLPELVLDLPAGMELPREESEGPRHAGYFLSRHLSHRYETGISGVLDFESGCQFGFVFVHAILRRMRLCFSSSCLRFSSSSFWRMRSKVLRMSVEAAGVYLKSLSSRLFMWSVRVSQVAHRAAIRVLVLADLLGSRHAAAVNPALAATGAAAMNAKEDTPIFLKVGVVCVHILKVFVKERLHLPLAFLMTAFRSSSHAS